MHNDAESRAIGKTGGTEGIPSLRARRFLLARSAGLRKGHLSTPCASGSTLFSFLTFGESEMKSIWQRLNALGVKLWCVPKKQS